MTKNRVDVLNDVEDWQMEEACASGSLSQIDHYLFCRREGTGHGLALMFALQQPPQIAGTDSIFNEGRCNGNQFADSPWMGDLYAAEAREAGVDVKGRQYLHGLARYPGDPEAWVSDRHDVQRVVERRGWGCHGAVNVKAQEPTSAPKDVALADDIVDDKVAEILERQVAPSEVCNVDVQDLREQVKERLTPHWAKE